MNTATNPLPAINPAIPVFDRAQDRSHLSAVLEILYVEQVPYKGKNGNPDGVMTKAACAVVEEDGRVQVGDLMIPRNMAPPVKGLTYDAEFKIGVSMDKKIGGLLVSLVPQKPSKPKAV
jgi:hypothetical protein